MANKEYDSFVDSPEKLTDGEMILAIRELTPDNPRKKYLTRYVKCFVSRDATKVPGCDTLWLRWQRGRRYPKPFFITNIQELGEFLPKEIRLNV